MRKTGLLAVLLVLVISAATLPSSLDGFLSPYSHGNLHMALNVNPIEVIRLLGREPDSYDYYASSQWLFTYLDASASTGVSGLAFIWEASSVKSIRVFVSGTLSPEGLLRLLGYEPDSLAAPVSGVTRLGNVPYYTVTYTLKSVFPNWRGDLTIDASLLLLLNHLDDSVYMLIVQ